MGADFDKEEDDDAAAVDPVVRLFVLLLLLRVRLLLDVPVFDDFSISCCSVLL